MRLPFSVFGLQERPEELVAIFYREQLISIYKAHDKYQDMMKPVKVIRTEIGE
jgi:tRNA pseudouridine55 synthase